MGVITKMIDNFGTIIFASCHSGNNWFFYKILFSEEKKRDAIRKYGENIVYYTIIWLRTSIQFIQGSWRRKANIKKSF